MYSFSSICCSLFNRVSLQCRQHRIRSSSFSSRTELTLLMLLMLPRREPWTLLGEEFGLVWEPKASLLALVSLPKNYTQVILQWLEKPTDFTNRNEFTLKRNYIRIMLENQAETVCWKTCQEPTTTKTASQNLGLLCKSCSILKAAREQTAENHLLCLCLEAFSCWSLLQNSLWKKRYVNDVHVLRSNIPKKPS